VFTNPRLPMAIEGFVEIRLIDPRGGGLVDATNEPPNVFLLENRALKRRQRSRNVLDCDIHQERATRAVSIDRDEDD